MLRPFTLDVPQAKLDRIMRRVADAEISYAPVDDTDWKYGVDRAYLSEFRDYWRDSYDWRAQEAWFNRFPQFIATIEGVDIQFYHVRAEGGDGFPLMLSHGWPGSVVEFMEVIPLLAAQGYDVVVPSLPGYGFSGHPAKPIGRDDVARMWRTLMVEVLGYPRFGAQGGDWGSPITQCLGRDHADVVSSIHVNMLFARRHPDRPADPELEAWLARGRRNTMEGGYSDIQRTKPQTIGLALADTPVGWAGWVLEKCRSWSDCGGDLESRFTKDALLNNIMTYLVGETIQSSFWLYYSLNWVKPGAARVDVPVGFAEFNDGVPPPRSALEPDYNIVRWTKMPKGGHFAAWEEPKLFADEVGSFFREWR